MEWQRRMRCEALGAICSRRGSSTKSSRRATRRMRGRPNARERGTAKDTVPATAGTEANEALSGLMGSFHLDAEIPLFQHIPRTELRLQVQADLAESASLRVQQKRRHDVQEHSQR